MFFKFKFKKGPVSDFICSIFNKDFVNLNRDPDLKGSDPVSFNGSANDEIIIGVRKAENTIAGNDGDDFIFGGKKSDTLLGNGDDDVLVGGRGEDILLGGAGMDRLYGGKNDDILSGDKDDDVLTGGRGADTFRFNDKLIDAGTAGVDTITDFNLYQGDKIEFFNLDGVENVVVEQDGSDVKISMDADGDGSADILVAIVEDSISAEVQSGIVGLASEDILLV